MDIGPPCAMVHNAGSWCTMQVDVHDVVLCSLGGANPDRHTDRHTHKLNQFYYLDC